MRRAILRLARIPSEDEDEGQAREPHPSPKEKRKPLKNAKRSSGDMRSVGKELFW